MTTKAVSGGVEKNAYPCASTETVYPMVVAGAAQAS